MARQTPPGARPSRTVDPARRGPGRSQGASAPARGFGPGEIDVRSRQDPAYRLAVGRPRFGGGFLYFALLTIASHAERRRPAEGLAFPISASQEGLQGSDAFRARSI